MGIITGLLVELAKEAVRFLLKRRKKGMQEEVKLLFVGVPKVEPMAFSNKYRVTDVFYVEYIYRGETKKFLVDIGFLTDGASIPSLFWRLIGTPFEPRFLAAAILHDKQCNLGFELEEMTALFAAMLRDAGVGQGTIWKMRLAVHSYMEGEYKKRGIL